MAAVKQYNILCSEKKTDYFNSLENKFSSIKESKEFWNLVNNFYGRRFLLAPSVSLNSPVTHFNALLNPPIFSASIFYAETYIEN